MSELLELDGVSAGYGPFRAIFDVSITIPEGGIVALLGANGAGKTTVARVVTGLIRADQGAVRFDGRDITKLRAWRIAKLGVVHAPEGRSVFGSLTVEENLALDFGRALGRRKIAGGLERAYELFPRLGERRKQFAATLSGGEQRMLSLARVLVNPPRLLVVDELSLGLAPIIIDELYATLRSVHEAGTTLLIVEQYVARALALATSVAVLEHGEVTYFGSVDDLGDIADKMLAHGHST